MLHHYHEVDDMVFFSFSVDDLGPQGISYFRWVALETLGYLLF